MLCPECNQHNAEGLAHCSQCGVALPQPTGPQPAPPSGPAAKRPTIFTVVAVLGLLSAPFGLVPMLTDLRILISPPDTGIPEVAALFADPTVRTYIIAKFVFGAAGGILGIAACIGLLCTKRWAYTLTIGLLIFGSAGFLVSLPITLGFLSRVYPLPPASVLVPASILLCVVTLLPLGLLLFLLLRRGTREAYQRAAT